MDKVQSHLRLKKIEMRQYAKQSARKRQGKAVRNNTRGYNRTKRSWQNILSLTDSTWVLENTGLILSQE